MLDKLYVRVVSHGNYRAGTSQKGNDYIMGEAYVFESDPNNPYPQKISYYCDSKDSILKSGEWAVPVSYMVRDNRLEFRLETKEALPYELINHKSQSVAAKSTIATSTTTKATA